MRFTTLILAAFLLLPGALIADEWEQVGQSLSVLDQDERIFAIDISDDGNSLLVAYFRVEINGAYRSIDRNQRKVFRVFDLIDGMWVQRGTKIETRPGLFGKLKLSGDGNTIATGHSSKTTGCGLSTYQWSEETSAWIEFGSFSGCTNFSLDLSTDGRTVGTSAPGFIYLYDKIDARYPNFGQTRTLLRADTSGGGPSGSVTVDDLLGFFFLSLANNGLTASWSGAFIGTMNPAVVVWDFEPISRTWHQRGHTIVAPLNTPIWAGTDISESGNTLFLTSERFDNEYTDAGIIQTFEYSENDASWVEKGVPLEGAENNQQLHGVQISNDGLTLLSGFHDTNDTQGTFSYQTLAWRADLGWAPEGAIFSATDAETKINDIKLAGEGQHTALHVSHQSHSLYDYGYVPFEWTPGQVKVLQRITTDSDSDGIPDEEDNCPADFNPDQADYDGDGTGDVCDSDVDGDLVNNEYDSCPNTPLGAAVEGTGCSLEQLCPCDQKNHGSYQSCVVQTANHFGSIGLLDGSEVKTIKKQAALSDCGK